MDINLLWVIVLLGLVLVGGKIEFNGALNRLRRQDTRKLTGEERKSLE